MPVKLVVFDLDGVLIDSRELHFKVFCRAVADVAGAEFVPTRDEHQACYDGHPTSHKLKLLTRDKGLSPATHDAIWARKQELTQEIILSDFAPDAGLRDVLRAVKALGVQVHCASNSVWQTVKNSLLVLGVLPYIDYFVSNEDVKRPKPAPDVYFRCFEHAGVAPREAVIVEDSPVGLKAARASGAAVVPVADRRDVTFERIAMASSELENPHASRGVAAVRRRVNVVIPAAGLGSRFAAAGYADPKPLIDVAGKPMLRRVVENLAFEGAHFVFVVQSRDAEAVRDAVGDAAPTYDILMIDGVTQGAACTVLQAAEVIDGDDPLVIANSDQLLDWDVRAFLYESASAGVDGCISVFDSTDPKFSFAELGDDGFVSRVAEKQAISNVATTGVYYWRHGADFVRCARRMIARDARVNGEFYVCPVFNEAIDAGMKIKVSRCERFHCLGTPEDLTTYLASRR